MIETKKHMKETVVFQRQLVIVLAIVALVAGLLAVRYAGDRNALRVQLKDLSVDHKTLELEFSLLSLDRTRDRIELKQARANLDACGSDSKELEKALEECDKAETGNLSPKNYPVWTPAAVSPVPLTSKLPPVPARKGCLGLM